MATSLRANVEDVIQCSVCLESMSDARALLCQHSCCYKCIERLVGRKGIKCPKCRKITPIPLRGIENLPQDFTINKLTAALGKTSGDETKPKVCATCLEPRSVTDQVWYCEDCTEYLCKNCRDAHQKTALFVDHKLHCITNIDSLLNKCNQHPLKEKRYLCQDCNVLICSACVTSDHQNHQVKDSGKQLILHKADEHNLLNLMQSGYSKYFVDNLKKIEIDKIEPIVVDRFSTIQSSIKLAAERNILQIKQEQVKLEKLLVRDMDLFASWLDSVRRAQSLITKTEDLNDSCGKQMQDIYKAEGDYQALSPQINAMAAQIDGNKSQLSSLSSLKIAMDFIAASSCEVSLGTISKTAEVHPGLEFSMFAIEPQPTQQGLDVGNTGTARDRGEGDADNNSEASAEHSVDSSDENEENSDTDDDSNDSESAESDEQESSTEVHDAVQSGFVCKECDRSIREIRYHCAVCHNYDLCSKCHNKQVHDQHRLTPILLPGPLHSHVQCDVCGESVVGVRYKCTECNSYDLCTVCKHENYHNEHKLKRVHYPVLRFNVTTDENIGGFWRLATCSDVESNFPAVKHAMAQMTWQICALKDEASIGGSLYNFEVKIKDDRHLNYKLFVSNY